MKALTLRFRMMVLPERSSGFCGVFDEHHLKIKLYAERTFVFCGREM